MARYQDIVESHRARRPVELDVGRDVPIKVDLRVLTPGEGLEVFAEATRIALEKGSADATEGNDIFDLCLWHQVALVACVDPESPLDAPVPFFASLEEIRGSRLLTNGHFAYLYQHHRSLQDEVSPLEHNLSHEDMIVRTAQIAAGELLPFVAMSPGMLWIWARTTAQRALASLAGKSSSTPSSPDTSMTPAN